MGGHVSVKTGFARRRVDTVDTFYLPRVHRVGIGRARLNWGSLFYKINVNFHSNISSKAKHSKGNRHNTL